jgi:hypothetical protein
LDPDDTPEPEKTRASLKPLTPLKNLLTLFKNLSTALKNLPIPKKLVIPAIAGAVVLTAGGAAFGLLHARPKHAVPQVKAAASAPVASTTRPSAACSGVVRDIYRQTVLEDPGVTLAEVRSEVLSSGVNCVPVPEIAAELKDLSPACRDMVQYTFLGVRDGHPDFKVNDIREKVVQKSVACEHDRPPNVASAARHKAK